MSAPQESSSFAELGLGGPLVAALATLGYEEPTPVQREAIPLLIEGRDLLGQAETGTGKTAAFALPMLQRLTTGKAGRGTAGLILVPTRELAMQVAEAIHKYARGSQLHVLPLYGGAPMQAQVRALERGAHVVVATPGRALDHLRRKTLNLDGLKMLVLDEADEMLDMGFAEDLDAILQSVPGSRQTALFSATMPHRILAIAERHLKDPARVTIAREKPATGKVPRVRQLAYIVHRAHKPATLARVLDMEDPAAALVFCRTRIEVDTLVETFNAHGQRAQALHGGMEQRQRDHVLGLFRAKKADLLVATDVAARGLDIEHLSHVVNYDVPNSPEAYVHRIGRTGRAGRAGTAITLAEPREQRLLRMIEQFTRTKMEMATVPTVADIRARRLDLTRAAIRERLVAGNCDDVRVIAESLTEEFDIVEIACAAISMVHAASVGDSDEREIPAPSAPGPERGRRAEPGRGDRPRAAKSSDRERSRNERYREEVGDTVRLYITAGRQAGIRPGDLVGAITGEADVPSRVVGGIEIADMFSLVEVPAALADRIIGALKQTTLRGKRVTVRKDRDG